VTTRRLELRCFGAPTALVDGRRAPDAVLWAKHLALLIYLALSPRRTRTRAQLIGALWGENEEAKARHALNQALSRLRGALGRDRLVSEGEAVTLSGNALDVDAERFDALVEREPGAAIAVLEGAFLDGFVVRHAPAFEEWAAQERARYASRAAAALVASGEQGLAALQHDKAAAAARRALALQPYHEPAVDLLLRALSLGGDNAGALAAYQGFVDRLAAELSEPPSAALQALAVRVRVSQPQARPPGPAPEEIPLAGRTALHQRLFTLTSEGVHAGPRAAFLTGDPGTGKSRLLIECGRRLSMLGSEVVATRCAEIDQDVAWSLLRALLVKGLLGATGSRATDPGALGVLSGLVPQPDGTPERRSPRDVGEASAALVALLQAVADERPLALLVDDAHFADDASLAAIGGAFQQLRAAPVTLVMAAVRAWDGVSQALLKLLADVGRDFPGAAFKLQPFSEEDTVELVRACSTWCKDDSQRRRLTRRVYFESSGNPLLACTLLRELDHAVALREEILQWPPEGGTLDAPLPFSVPDLVRRAIVARLRRLDAEHLGVLVAACVGGRVVDVALVEALTGLPQQRVEDVLARLERERLMVFDGDCHALAAPLVGDVVLGEWLLPGERRTLGARAHAALAGRADLPSRLQRVRLRLEFEPGAASFDDAVELAGAALDEGRPRIAQAALRLAERSPGAAGPAARRKLEDVRSRLPS